jgi:hypothetical protein
VLKKKGSNQRENYGFTLIRLSSVALMLSRNEVKLHGFFQIVTESPNVYELFIFPRMVRAIRDKHYEETKDMTSDEKRKYYPIAA